MYVMALFAWFPGLNGNVLLEKFGELYPRNKVVVNASGGNMDELQVVWRYAGGGWACGYEGWFPYACLCVGLKKRDTLTSVPLCCKILILS